MTGAIVTKVSLGSSPTRAIPFIALALASCAAVPAAPPGVEPRAGSNTAYLVGDIAAADQSTVTHCGYVLDSAPKVDVPVGTLNAQKVCKVDLSSVANGQHTATLTTVKNDATWGRLESAPSSPFSFNVPAAGASPSNLRITQ